MLLLDRSQLARVGLGFALSSAAFVVSAQSQSDGVVPHLNRAHYFFDTQSTRAWFGYTNANPTVTSIIVGPDNFFTPGNPNRGQPRLFESGTHDSVFSVLYNTPDLKWTLGPNSASSQHTDAIGILNHTNEQILDWTITLLAFEDHAGSWLHHTANTTTVGHATVFDGALFHEDGGTFNSTVFANQAGGLTRIGAGTVTASTSFQNAGVLELGGGTLDTPALVNLSGGVVNLTDGTNLLPENFQNAGTLRGTGGALSRESFTNATGATIEWEAGNFETTTLTNAGTLIVEGGRVDATDSFTNSGALRLADGVLSTASLSHTGFIDWRGGTLELTSGNLTTDTAGPLGANPLLGQGTLHLTTGATLNTAGRTLVLNPGAELITQGGTNEGTLVVTLATLTSESGTFANATGATLNATAATLAFTGDGIANDNDGIQNLGTLNLIDTTITGDVRSPAGSIVNVASGVTFTGFFSGAATFTGGGLATFSGGYSPGDSPALVSHAGSLTLLSPNVLTMELAGSGLFTEARGTLYDALDIAGTFTPGGTLQITFLDGFNPIGGESFDLFNFSAIAGEFDAFAFPALTGSLTWNTSALYTNGVLSITASAIPEPSTYAALLGAFVLGLAAWCKQRIVR